MVNYDTACSKAAYKYFLKAFYNRTNKKEYNSQIRQHNIRYTNIITMKDMITVVKKSGENKELLAIENVDKIAIVKVTKMSSAIDLKSKHSWAINNADIDAAGNLKLIGIKKY